MCRGLLLFDEGMPLGIAGLAWLKVQLANVFGFDKATFAEREQFTMNNLENVFDSADNPLNGKGWWKDGDYPYQVLAACIELTNALRSDDSTAYICRLPIQQDGTCNGLQHYAALGGDPIGAQQVNLEPSDRPQDVYSAVASYVQERIDEEAKTGHPLASLLNGQISRKVVKTTVMTSVYGVTMSGARLQVREQLDDKKSVPLELSWEASGYVAKHIFGTLSTLFEGAHHFQSWLTCCARRITRSLPISHDGKGDCMSTIVWTTPLGLPVVQPYRKESRRQIKTHLSTITIADPSSMQPIDGRRQVNAFAPNYIHSLDASHMLMSATACTEQNITFAAVHDSYWCHAGNVDKMADILRDAFIALHSDDQIYNLREELTDRYKDRKMLVRVPADSPDANKLATDKNVLKYIGPDEPQKAAEVVVDENDEATLSKEISFGNLSAEDECGSSTESNTVLSEQSVPLNPRIHSIASKPIDYVYAWVPVSFPPLPKRVCRHLTWSQS